MRFLRLNSWADCVAISMDIVRHGSVFLVQKEDVGSLELYALPPMTHLHKPPI